MRLKKLALLALLTPCIFYSSGVSAETVSVRTASEVNLSTVKQEKKNVLNTELDAKGRPVRSRFIGNDAYQEGKRVGKPSEPANLQGRWYQQNLAKKGEKPVYLWDRGHLVGNQFAGYPSNEATNIVGQTSYANQKVQTYIEGGLKTSNKNALDNWLYLHPNFFLEYEVTAQYATDEDNYPISNTLRFRGLDKNGNPIRIQLPDGNLEGLSAIQKESDEWSSVTVQNIYPGWKIDYKTGVAVPDTGESSTETGREVSTTGTVKESRPADAGKGEVSLKQTKTEGLNLFEEVGSFLTSLFKLIVNILRSGR